MTATAQQRIETLGALLAAKFPLAPLAAVLASYEWDSPPLVVLRREHVVSVLRRFLAGEVQAGFVQEWADLVEMRDDIDYEEGHRMPACASTIHGEAAMGLSVAPNLLSDIGRLGVELGIEALRPRQRS